MYGGVGRTVSNGRPYPIYPPLSSLFGKSNGDNRSGCERVDPQDGQQSLGMPL